jgi:uncharacterized protein (DUF885 family)
MMTFSRRTALALLGASALSSPHIVSAAETPEDAEFNAIAKSWLEGTFRHQPVYATQIGDHAHDGQIDDVSTAGRKARADFLQKTLDDLKALDRSKLSRANQVDAALLENDIKSNLWDNAVLQSWAWDPFAYQSIAGNSLYLLLAREFAPQADRLRSATARMEALPTLFEQMRANLDPARVPEIHAKTVAKQFGGIGGLVDTIVAQQGALPANDRTRLTAAANKLKAAAKVHQDWLDKTLVPSAKGNFRIGAKLYDEKLAFALLSPMTRQEIRSNAEAAVKRIRSEMYGFAVTALAKQPNAPATPAKPTDEQQQTVIEAALKLAYAEKPTRDQFVQACRDAVIGTTAFVREKDLITLPDAPVNVIETPEFNRGVSGAYCDSPGPLDQKLGTYVCVDPIPTNWTQEQADSYLREYNGRNIHELIIHEAMPGHYTQIWHSNQYPSVLRAVLGSGSFIEGWACYAEDVMADANYLNGDPLYKLVHLKLDLRSTVNAILDQAIQVDGMSRDEALHLMTVTAFQEKSEAEGKWIRAQVTSAQLPTYFVGLTEHHALRTDAEKRQGSAFNLKAYHDKVLSFGSPPARYVRALMFDEPIV